MYRAETNTHRAKRALDGLFKVALCKDAVNRVWCKVKTDWKAWCTRSLANEGIVLLIRDGTVIKTQVTRNVTNISVFATIGVRRDGQKVLFLFFVALLAITLHQVLHFRLETGHLKTGFRGVKGRKLETGAMLRSPKRRSRMQRCFTWERGDGMMRGTGRYSPLVKIALPLSVKVVGLTFLSKVITL